MPVINAAVPIFLDLDGGPLEDGYIYIGTVNLNPEVSPIAVYWDAALTQPAAQPLRTIGGMVVRNGTVANIYSAAQYSITVRDKHNRLVMTFPDSTTFNPASLEARLADQTDPTHGAALVGYYDPVAPAYLKTVSDIINGEEVSLFRFIPPSKHEGIFAGTNTDNLATYFNDAFNGVAAHGRGRLKAPAGTYNLSNVTAPAGLKSFRGAGQATKLQATGAVWAAFTPWLYFNGVLDIDLGDFWCSIDQAVYTQQHAIYLGSVAGGKVSNIHIAKGGYIGIYASACTDVTIDNININNFGLYAVHADTAPQSLELSNIRVAAAGAGHTISIVGGIDHNIHDCRVNGTPNGSFAISLVQASQSKIHSNIVRPTYLEGIQLTDGHQVQILGNQILCAAGTHTDMGISLSAETADVYDCLVQGNSVYNSGAPGIGLASDSRLGTKVCERNTVQGNTIFNPNRQNNANYSGIWVFGQLSSNNTVRDNEIQDQTSNVKYGCSEYNNGDGVPNGYNKFINNTVRGSGLTGQTLLLAATSEKHDVDLTSFTPTVTSTSGTITTATGAMKYRTRGKFIDVDLTVTVTTNGTGATAIQVTTPWTTMVNGSLNGRAAVISGKQVNAAPSSGSNLVIYAADNSYPGASGETIKLSGILEIS